MNFKIGDKVTYDGTTGIIRSLMPDHNSNGKPVTADVRFDGETIELDLNSLEKVIKPKKQNLPRWAVGWCHYCGQPAKGFGFFDEPACSECGGS